MDSFLSKVGSAAASAAAATKTLAARGAEAAGAGARRAAAHVGQLAGGSHALSLVGQEVTVRGKVLKIQQLLAEGARARRRCAALLASRAALVRARRPSFSARDRRPRARAPSLAPLQAASPACTSPSCSPAATSSS